MGHDTASSIVHKILERHFPDSESAQWKSFCGLQGILASFYITGTHLVIVACAVALLLCARRATGGAACARELFGAQARRLLSGALLAPADVRRVTLQFDELQDTLRTRWKGADLFPYGSIFTGLGTKTSDIDFYLRIPNYNKTADAYIVKETAQILYKQPERYTNIRMYLNIIVPMMSFYDTKMQRDLDLSFRADTGVVSTKVVSYYLNLDKRYVPLTAIIKLWGKVHHLTGKRLLPNYALYLMVIFYLQQKNMSPPMEQLQIQPKRPLIQKWNNKFEEKSYSVENDESLYDLLGGFFKYYSDFDFTNYCTSEFVGRPVAKSEFGNVNNIPKEFSLYKSYLTTGKVAPLPLDSAMCVQEMFEHNVNVARRFRTNDVLRFKNLLKIATNMYKNVPCNVFLREILLNNVNSLENEINKS